MSKIKIYNLFIGMFENKMGRLELLENIDSVKINDNNTLFIYFKKEAPYNEQAKSFTLQYESKKEAEEDFDKIAYLTIKK